MTCHPRLPANLPACHSADSKLSGRRCLASWTTFGLVESGVQQCPNLESISKLGRRTHHARRGGRFMVGSLGSLNIKPLKLKFREHPPTSYAHETPRAAETIYSMGLVSLIYIWEVNEGQYTIH